MTIEENEGETSNEYFLEKFFVLLANIKFSFVALNRIRKDSKNDFALMPEEISKRITSKTKILVLVSPNNPTGAVTPPEKIIEIAEIVKNNKLIVITDEIYADLVYENHTHLSIGSLEEMKGRTLTLNGFSKTYFPSCGVTG